MSPAEAATLRVRRYADELMPLGDAPPEGGSLVLRIPTDRSAVPWELELSAAGPKSVCGIGSG